MADMINVAKLRAFKEQHPNIPVVCYINSTAEVKAECDICCTSSNALEIVKSLNAEKVLLETKPDVAEGPATVTWTISGCKTDANIPDEGCEWSGVATGNCKTGTATVSKKNEELQPSVVVKNDEFSTMQVPCTAIKAWDSNNVTETITWPSENTTLTAGTYTITDCKGSTGTKTIQVGGGSSETCNTWFGATGWSGGPWSTCNGQISVSFPVTLEVPEGGSVILSNNCW